MHGKTLMMGLAFGALALLILLGGYMIFKVLEAGRRAAKEPGTTEFRSASNRIAPHGPPAGGNNAKATRLAADMSKLMKSYREKNFSQATKKSFMDAGDDFRTYCNLEEGRCVFLIHVPELRRFNVEGKKSLADSAWFFAQGLLGKSGDHMHLAVALRGIAT